MADGHFIQQIFGLGRFTDKPGATKKPGKPTPIPNVPLPQPVGGTGPKKPTPIPGVAPLPGLAPPRTGRASTLLTDTSTQRKTLLGT